MELLFNFSTVLKRTSPCCNFFWSYWQRAQFAVLRSSPFFILHIVARNQSNPGRSMTEVSGVELVAAHGSEASNDITRAEINPSFFRHVGTDGIVIICPFFLLAGGSFYAYYEYSHAFKAWDREDTWVLLAAVVLCTTFGTYLVLTWERNVVASFKKITQSTQGDSFAKQKSIAVNTWRTFRETRRLFNTSGPLYFWKCFLLEIIEGINHTRNFLTVYICSLPLEFNITIAFITAIDGFFKLHYLLRTVLREKDKRILLKVDSFLDTFYMIVPLMFLWVVFKIPVTLAEFYSLTLIPTIALLSKLRSLYRGNILQRVFLDVVHGKSRNSNSAKHKQQVGVLDETFFETIANEQNKRFPKFGRKVLGCIWGLHGTYFLIYGVIQTLFVTSVWSPLKCSSSVLWQRCLIKVPFCDQPIPFGNAILKCNCAVLDIRGHNMTTLPSIFSQEMTALKTVKVVNGPLQQLPEHIGQSHKNLANLDVRFNQLKDLPKSLGHAIHLNWLNAEFNRISTVPTSIWRHHGLSTMRLNSNRITAIDEDVFLPNLVMLILSNNSIADLPQNMHMPHISVLILDGNDLQSITTINLRRPSLKVLSLSRNRLTVTSFEGSVDGLRNLRVLDLRNNSLDYLPRTFKALSNVLTVFVSGNPLCAGSHKSQPDALISLPNIDSIICDLQCSIYCLDYLTQNSECDDNCNSKSCQMDNGACDKN